MMMSVCRSIALLVAATALFGIILPLQVNGLRKGRNQCDCVCGVSDRGQKIVGGEEALRHEFPWIATLSYNGTFYCGASLITNRHLLTAAHCIYGKSARWMTVGLGEHDRREEGQQRGLKVRRATMHPSFSLAKVINDIGIIELTKPVHPSPPAVRTACLPSSVGADYNGLEGVVAGWGRDNEYGKTTQLLRKVSLPLIDSKTCGGNFGYSASKIPETVFCAGYKAGAKDACQGDSGGPLHINKNSSGKSYSELIGVVSWGRGCARPNYPGVYTRIDKYMTWIDQQLKGDCLCHPPHPQ